MRPFLNRLPWLLSFELGMQRLPDLRQIGTFIVQLASLNGVIGNFEEKQ